MNTVEKYRDLNSDPIAWFNAHLGSINAIVYTYWRDAWCKLYAYSSSSMPAKVNSHRRRFSEMPNCETWEIIEDKLGLPSGFTRIPGSLSLIGDPSSKIDHQYLKNANDIVFCHTGAQAIDSGVWNTQPGQKMVVLRQRAIDAGRPDLYQIVGNYGIVYGHKDDIKKHLGLIYE